MAGEAELGDLSDGWVIEVHVAPGDTVAAEDPLMTIESDKTTVDIPAPTAGVVQDIRVAAGDPVDSGVPVVLLRPLGDADAGDADAPDEGLKHPTALHDRVAHTFGPSPRPAGRSNSSDILTPAVTCGLLGLLLAEARPGGLGGVAGFVIAAGIAALLLVLLLVGLLLSMRRRKRDEVARRLLAQEVARLWQASQQSGQAAEPGPSAVPFRGS